MNEIYQKLRMLQSRMLRGDPDAVVEFRYDILPVLSRIVRRSTSSDVRITPLTRSIRALTAQLEGSVDCNSESCFETQRVACRLCELLVAQLAQARPPSEQLNRTVRSGLATLTSV